MHKPLSMCVKTHIIFQNPFYSFTDNYNTISECRIEIHRKTTDIFPDILRRNNNEN